MNLCHNHRESGISELEPRLNRDSLSDLKHVTERLLVPYFPAMKWGKIIFPHSSYLLVQVKLFLL